MNNAMLEWISGGWGGGEVGYEVRESVDGGSAGMGRVEDL